jgi:hypothetical protein
LEKQEWIERSLVELIHSTNGSIKFLKFQTNVEISLLGNFLGYKLLEYFTSSTIEDSKHEFSFWGKTLPYCIFMGIFCFHVKHEFDLQRQKEIHDDSVRDLPIVRQRIADLKAEAKSHFQPPRPTNNSENGMTLNMR